MKKVNVPMDASDGGDLEGVQEGLVVSWSLALVRSCNTSPERDSYGERHSNYTHIKTVLGSCLY